MKKIIPSAAFLLASALLLLKASQQTTGAGIPQTGDTSHLYLWIGIGAAALAALILLIVTGRKKK